MITKIIKMLLQTFTFGRFLYLRKKSSGAIYLTFDDGPNPEYTERFLDVLKANNIKATFFLVGKNVERFPEIAKRIVNEGHSVGGHTYHHVEITSMTPKELSEDLDKTRDVIFRTTGVNSTLFRPPRGKVNIKCILHSLVKGYSLVHWSVTFSDYLKDGRRALVERADNYQLGGGDIVLLHDNNPFTLQMLPDFCAQYKKDNYKFMGIN